MKLRWWIVQFFLQVTNLKARGIDFLSIPKSYYVILAERLKSSATKITENMETIQKLNILIDFDENGYLLQIFSKPVQDRPTLFLEVIQRRNFQVMIIQGQGRRYWGRQDFFVEKHQQVRCLECKKEVSGNFIKRKFKLKENSGNFIKIAYPPIYKNAKDVTLSF